MVLLCWWRDLQYWPFASFGDDTYEGKEELRNKFGVFGILNEMKHTITSSYYHAGIESFYTTMFILF